MTAVERVLRGVLKLGPRGFRERYGPEIVQAMSEALVDERRQNGRLAMAKLSVRGLVDAARVVSRERRAAAQGPGRRPLADWRGDVTSVLRSWWRTPAFTLTIVLTLTLSLGLATAIFSFADGYLFRELPFPHADRLYLVSDPNADIASALRASDTAALRGSAVSEYGFVEWSSARLHGELLVDGRAVSILAYEVTRGFRTTVPLPLLAGRDFTDADHDAGAPLVAWIGYRFWKRELGGDESVVNRTFKIQTPGALVDVHVAGVLGPAVASFDLNNPPPELIVPAQGPPRTGPNLLSFPIVRLADGVTREQAASRIAATLQAAAPAADGRPRTVRLGSVHESQVRGGRPTARVFFAAALLVLALAAVTIVHLLLTRGVARAGEIATRLALGASRWRIVRLFLTEGLLLAAAGIGGGVLAGWWLSQLLAARVPGFPTAGRNLALVPMLFDGRVIGFAALLGTIVAFAGSLWPAWRAIRRPAMVASRSAGGVVTTVPRRLSRAMLASELVIATVVMVGTLFVGVGIWRYLNQPLGFDYQDRFSVSLTPSEPRRLRLDESTAAVRALRDVPGVTAASAVFVDDVQGPVEVDGRAVNPKSTAAARVSLDYIAAWQLRLRAGRWFDTAEAQSDAPVAIVDTSFAAVAWPDVSALGQRVRFGAGAWREVIGIVEPQRLRLAGSMPMALLPAAELSGRGGIAAWVPGAGGNTEMIVRLERALAAAVPGARATIRPITFESLFLRDASEAMFQAPVVAVFGVMALLLAGAGVFGLVSYLVAQRTREFGIRLAMGARRQHIWRTVMGESLLPAAVGLALGIPTARLLESIVESRVFGWSSSGFLAAALVAIALAAIALLASVPPARRAMRIDPADVLRSE